MRTRPIVDRTGRSAKTFRRALLSESGVALVMALLTVVVLLLLGAGLVAAAMTEVFTAQTAEDSGRALNVAEAGLAHAIQVLREDRDWSNSEEATGGCPGAVDGWQVLRDHRSGDECLSDRPYPSGAAFSVSPAAPGSPDAECASIPVSVGSGGGGGGAGAAPAEVGKYTVLFHPTQDRTANTLRVRVIGKVGRAQRGVEALLARVTPADFVAYSASTVDSTVRSGSGTFTVHGSVYIRGDWAFKGNSSQLNDRPIVTGDEPPYGNQTYVCGDLAMQGSAQIGTRAQPMKAVHVAGVRRPTGNAQIYANRVDKAVPDIRLGDVALFVRCIAGQPQQDRQACENSFGSGIWASYTNEVSYTNEASEGSMQVVIPNDPGSENDQWKDLTLNRATVAFLLPKKGRGAQCRSAAEDNLNRDGSRKPGGNLSAVMAECAAFYDASARRLYVAGSFQENGVRKTQIIYVPGRVVIGEENQNRDFELVYVVDNNPDASPQEEKDTAMIVVGCETCSTDALYVGRGARLLARNRGSQNPNYARTDLLAFVVNRSVRLEGAGQASQSCSDRSDQEQNAVFVTGGTPGELFTKFRLQLIGAIVARRIVMQDDGNGPGQAYNVRWCQVPNLKDLVAETLLGQFLNDPRSSSIVIREWREIGL